MKRLLLVACIVSLVSFGYYETKLDSWFDHHKPSQGMPQTLDMEIAEYLATPIFWIRAVIERGCNEKTK